MARPLGIQLDPTQRAPLYRQIFEQIAGRIREGTFPAGYRLPATRRLAEELETHRNTVVRAFEELVTAGFVESMVGRGTFVTNHQRAAAPRAKQRPTGLPWSSLLSAASDPDPQGQLARLSAGPVPSGSVNLTRMQPPPELLPTEPLRLCLDHVLRTQQARALGYAPRGGLPRLRELLATELERAGVPAPAEDILITTGSQQGIDLIARALVDPGDTFIVEGATYSGAINVLATARAHVVDVAGDAEGPDIAALDAVARTGPTGRTKGLYLIPNCRNPTGATVSAHRRTELVAWSRRTGVPLIEDDYGADLDLDGKPAPPALRALDADVLYLGTFSKKLIPALRVGFVVAPRALSARLSGVKHTMDLGTSTLLQHALAEFIERGYLEAHLRRSLPEYRRRRDALVEALEQHLPRSVTFDRPERGVILWLRLPRGLHPETVFQEAQRQGVLVTPGTLYTVSAREEAGLRLTYCTEPPERLVEGARRLGRALEILLARSPSAEPLFEVL